MSIILFFYLFQNRGLTLFLEFNIYFYLFLFILCLTLISNSTILFLFNIYTSIKNCITVLNKINFNCLNLNRKNKIIVFPFSAQARSFSTSSKLYKDEGPNLDNLDYKSDQSL